MLIDLRQHFVIGDTDLLLSDAATERKIWISVTKKWYVYFCEAIYVAVNKEGSKIHEGDCVW